MTNRIVNIDHQLQRLSDMTLAIEPTKTFAGTRKLPIIEDVEDELRRLENLKVNYSTEKVKNLSEDLRIAKKFLTGIHCWQIVLWLKQWRIIIELLDENEQTYNPCNIDEIAKNVRIVEIMEMSRVYQLIPQ